VQDHINLVGHKQQLPSLWSPQTTRVSDRFACLRPLALPFGTPGEKKTGAIDHLCDVDHVGLLFN
jgi:hypothetical protein